ncbi:beta-ketoacyl synthase domain-containing protein [Colletotrichum zoysiae]|uniref:Beta-ketoacyl synthase domain-containing protein n=1 Tax=Colletotrichum zoysiae TaxID=1216348 RepID=A0AAD9LVS9_9PEZI|nr:beta-ketoacyl synthase domain-containing protein [Colletotrichum zoysiae]
MSGVKSTTVPIYSAFHASHQVMPDVGSIIGTSPVFNSRVVRGSTLFSSSSGTPYEAETLYNLLHGAISDIFQNRLLPSKTVDSALRQQSQDSRLTVHIFGPSNARSFWEKSLAALGLHYVQVQLSETVQASGPQDAIAIVGMSGRFPGGKNLQAFWDILIQAKDLHKKVPKDRFDVDLHCDLTGKTLNSTLSAFGCFLERPGYFDNLLFNMSPREALQTDPCQRLLLMAAYEALETAGYRYDVKPDGSNVGSFMGLTTDDWREYNISQEVDMYFVTGGLRSFGSGRLNYFFKLEGPSYVLDTAYSSSAASIELACASLLGHECDMALAGGANVMTGPNLWAGLSRAGFVSPTGSCKTFDETADGYCRGDGVGVIVLERLEDAIEAGDNIQGVIRGISTNHSANADSITQPHGPTQRKLYNQVLQRANLTPDQIRYVEMHGTGTQAGDVAEMNSVYSTFASGREPNNPLYVGGVKANVGHGEAAAGVTSVIKALMMFRENAVPPHAGIKTIINPKFPPLAKANIHIASEIKPFMTEIKPRRILIDNFGATGGNTCMVIEEPTKRHQVGKDPRMSHVVTVSAKTRSALKGNKQPLLDYTLKYPDTTVENVAYTLTSRRTHHPLRSAFCVSSGKELVRALSSDLSGTAEHVSNASQAPMVFVFPGQGAKFFGLAKNLYSSCPTFQRSILKLDNMVKSLDLPPFIDLILRDQLGGASPTRTHLAIVALEIALAQLLSLGEYAALCTAGVLTVADTLFLAGRRAQLVEKLCAKDSYGMLTVSASAARVQAMISSSPGCGIAIACFNSPGSVVVNGQLGDLERFRTALQEEKAIKSTFLPTPYAFHSAQLDPMLEPYQALATSVHFSKPSTPVVSTLLGKVVDEEGVFSPSYLAQQTRKPVLFEKAIQAACNSSQITTKTLMVEVGPDTMCLSMARTSPVSPLKQLPTLQSANTGWNTLSNIAAEAYVAGASVDWAEFHRPYKAALSVLDLPTYHFDLKNFWIQYRGGVAALEKDIAQKPPIHGARALESGFLGTCLHRLESEQVSKENGSVDFSVDLQESSLRKLIDGHNVIGIAPTPSGVYQEMARSAAPYLHARLNPGASGVEMTLKNLDIFAPLVLSDSKGPQVAKVRATTSSSSNVFSVTISSDKDHSRCEPHVQPSHQKGSLDDWRNRRAAVEHRTRELLQPTSTEPSYRLFRQMVYKIFSPITDYSSEYWSINEVFINYTALTGGRQYLCYVRAESSDSGSSVVCKATVFDDTSAVAIGEGLKFKRVKKARLRQLLGLPSPTALPVASQKVSSPPPPQNTLVKMPVLEPPSSARREEKPSHGGTSGNEQLSAVLKVISSEVGTQIEEVETHTTLEDLGVDSLLTVAITSRLKTEQNVELPATLIAGPTTISELVAYFEDRDSQAADNSHSEESIVSVKTRNYPSSQPQRPLALEGLQMKDILLSVISKESGLDLGEISLETPLADIGVDSLMSIAIIGAVKEQTGTELPASLLTDCATISQVVRKIASQEDDREEYAPFPLDDVPAEAPPLPVKVFDPEEYHSNVVLLQGKPQGQQRLFLVTDGSGSAAVYLHLPKLAPNLTVYALEAPFLGRASEFTGSMEQIGSIYARAIRSLVEGGKHIYSFLVFDAACPKKLQGIPEVTVEVCEMTGIFDSISETDKRRPLSLEQKTYVAGCVKCVMHYDPAPLPVQTRPMHTFIIWARNGFFDKLSDKVVEADKILTAQNGLQKEANPDWMDKPMVNMQTFRQITTETGPLVQKLAKKMLSTLSTPRKAAAIESCGAAGKIRETFQDSTNLVLKFAEKAGCSGFWDKVYPTQIRLVLAFVTESLARMGCKLDDMVPGQTVEISNTHPRHRNLLTRGGRFLRTPERVDATPSWVIYNQLMRDHPLQSSEHQLLQVAGSKLAECLTGVIDPLNLIFGKSRRLLQDFYTNAPMFVAASTECVEVLEVGAGLGGTTKYVLDKLVENKIPFRYTYTDISPSFLAEAKNRYSDLPVGIVEVTPLDIEKTPPERLCGRYSVVLSSNCIHATKGLAVSSANIKKLLRPNGFVVLVEFTTRLSWLDLVFGLLEGWWRFEISRPHCLADEELWRTNLKKAGFNEPGQPGQRAC